MPTWVVGDIHGCFDDFMTLLNNENIKPDDRIILIGDIIDRGPDSYKMLCWAMEHISRTGKYQMVLGNHEDNIIANLTHCRSRFAWGYYPDSVKTLDDLEIKELHTRYDFDQYMSKAGFCTVGSIVPFVNWFKTLPLYKTVLVKDKEGEIKKYLIAHAWYDESPDRDVNLWYRDFDFDYGDWRPDYKPKKGEILIHGHTPTTLFKALSGKSLSDPAEVFFRENSINIDCGCFLRNTNSTYPYGGRLAAIRLEDQYVLYV